MLGHNGCIYDSPLSVYRTDKIDNSPIKGEAAVWTTGIDLDLQTHYKPTYRVYNISKYLRNKQ